MNGHRISSKLWLTVGGMVLTLGVLAGAGAWWLVSAQARADAEQQAVQVGVDAATQWMALTESNAVRTHAVVLSTDAKIDAAFKGAISQTSAQISEVQKKLEAMPLRPEDKAQMAKFSDSRKAMLDSRAAARKLKEADKADEAAAYISNTYQPAVNAYLGNLREFVAMQRALLADLHEKQAKRRSAALVSAGAALAVLGVLLLLGARWLIRSISRPLAEANTVAAAIAEGDLGQGVAVTRADEFGELQLSLQRMSSALANTVGRVREASGGILTASSEIALGNHDLARRTEQASTHLQSTSSAMAQLTATVSQSAGNAKQASALATDAMQVAERGGAVVSEVVTTMHDINSSSKQIADIVGVIDGIAFQTNILALNAAVEAARAGEQGRGFAVVAGEVRTLAQRSAQAAKEIKQLIAASVEKVDGGAALVSQAGSTMADIVESVRKVTSIIAEISASASEQSAGIASVNNAVNELDLMTQQNAALVEQSASAAESLTVQAKQLDEVVATFKTGGSHTSAARAVGIGVPAAVRPVATLAL